MDCLNGSALTDLLHSFDFVSWIWTLSNVCRSRIVRRDFQSRINHMLQVSRESCRSLGIDLRTRAFRWLVVGRSSLDTSLGARGHWAESPTQHLTPRHDLHVSFFDLRLLGPRKVSEIPLVSRLFPTSLRSTSAYQNLFSHTQALCLFPSSSQSSTASLVCSYQCV